MYGRTGNLYPFCQRGFMHAQTVEALSAEGGDEGGVDVEDGVGEGGHHLSGKDVQEAGQHHQPDIQLTELVHQGHGHLPVGGEVFPGHHIAGDAGPGGPLQGVGVGPGGEHGGDAAVFQLTPALGVDQCLEVGAPAGNQDGNSYHAPCPQTSSTPASPLITSPMT